MNEFTTLLFLGATSNVRGFNLKPLPDKKIKTACAAGRVTYSRRLAMSMSKKCGACEKTIYPNDPKLSMGDHTYHKSCSKCEVCGGQLNIKNFATSGGRLVRSFWSLVSCLLSRCVGAGGWQSSNSAVDPSCLSQSCVVVGLS